MILLLSFLLGLNVFFVLRGALNGASDAGVMESIRIYILFPSTYIIIIAIYSALLGIRKTTLVLIAVSMTVCFITIAQELRGAGFGILPGYQILFVLYPGLENNLVTYSFSGTVGYLPRAMERLVFLAPFSVGLIECRKELRLGRISVFSNLIMVLTAVAFSERRAFMIITLLTIVMVITRILILNIQKEITFSSFVCVVAILSFGFVCITGIYFVDGDVWVNGPFNAIKTVFSDLSFQIRKTQIQTLLKATSEVPILGAGFGHAISGYSRDWQYPWRFELSYIALLYQTGALGFVMYIFLAVQLSIVTINALKKGGSLVRPYFYGLLGGLMAVATNPYLNYGTGQWIIFLPLAVFNMVLLSKSGSQNSIDYPVLLRKI